MSEQGDDRRNPDSDRRKERIDDNTDWEELKKKVRPEKDPEREKRDPTEKRGD